MTQPGGYTFRPPTWDDLHAVVDVVRAQDIAEYGAPDTDEADVRDAWSAHPPEQCAMVAVADDGTIAAAAIDTSRRPPRMEGRVHVHPQHAGRGLGTHLTRWIESRVANAAGDGFDDDTTLGFFVATVNKAAMQLLEHEGYSVIRHNLRMEIDLNTPRVAVPADGVTVRAYEQGVEERALHETLEDAFRDHWDHHPRPYEEFEKGFIGSASFDASLCFVAADEGEIAGIALCSVFESMGWVAWLGVRRPWRRRGVAVAMLHHAFDVFQNRGLKSAGLGVDAESLTGAPRVYERAGMHRTREYAIFRKPVALLR
jgi:ribosomal protein S18 acetylase RimI-like enzyme